MACYLKPCRGCPVVKQKDSPKQAPCEMRDVMRARVSGLGLSSASFRCEILSNKLQRGTRVVLNIPDVDDQGDHPYGMVSVSTRPVRATVTWTNGAQYTCVIDKEYMDPEVYYFPENSNPDKMRWRKKRPIAGIVEILEGERRQFCEVGNIKLPDGTCDRQADEVCHCQQFDHEFVGASEMIK